MKRIPYEISAVTDDFYNEYNQDRIKKAMDDIKAGKGVDSPLLVVFKNTKTPLAIKAVGGFPLLNQIYLLQ